ncbi:MAG: DNA polymerase I [Pseudodesulfovibrio sp.]|uniref:DNA polymerase I n=1 Tax=Pseudodesulfovibrio aespoeensis (strain ATCC 700646 / DSM 10631 / Aspo-2) TaxID=643562 RepID=E6VUY6_PSEA9|nr:MULTISPECIES: DNA polymerase I [Pseudodesulfovibrio]MBU4192424.1 DNA polymerase I [Pseudomonadota bacterium]ADU63494.1 DNA polymerase I [Pseudodesulfovibrio aespoeensis Aspo-2]MBU4243427.1 DNA polymerase I [Pseudomonadota bacterium]MBU4380344.1 DNA polymerase I [Pseudomonadota bacterium]MBU4475773.1 DNA polymerase I [Pseudomonadota bacterium]
MSLKDRLRFDKEPVYLIDGTALFYRAFYARTDLARADGFPTNAINTTLRVLLNMLRDENPRYVAFMMDGKGPTFRHQLYDRYKAQRPAMPEPLAMQIEPVRRGVELLGVRLLVSDGVEADDCICALAKRYKQERPVVVVASDKDLKQCLDHNVVILNQAGKTEKIITLESFREEEGMEPSQWPDFQAIIGDSADNIPGIPKVGPVTARKIMETCPTLEALRDNCAALPAKLREKVEPELENVFLYRELTRMKTDCCDQPLDHFALQPMDLDGLRAFLDEYELRGLKQALPKTSAPSGKPGASGSASSKTSGGASPQAGGQFSLFGAPMPAPAQDDEPPMTEATSTDALPSLAGEDVGLVFEDNAFFIGMEGREYRYTGPADALARALEHASVIATPSVQDLLRADAAWGYLLSSQWFDLSLAAYLLDPEARNYTWPRLRQSLFQDGRSEFAELAATLHPKARGLAALAYMRGIRGQVESAHLSTLMRDLEIPLIPVLVSMEQAGIGVDLDAFAGFLDDVSTQLDELTRSIIRHAGEPFNIRSSQQLAAILFDKLDIKEGNKTATGQRSTANQVLEAIRSRHPIVEDILEYRMLEKLRSTYLEPLPKLVGEDSRLHTHFNQLATATGRLSSSQPNLQNIPIRGKHGPRMRACFIAGPGAMLAAADYSQIELRVLAHFSGDPALIDAFRNDEDIHTRTAALLTDKQPQDVLADERRNAKTINFGLIYGMGPQKLARELDITVNQAKEFIERYFDKLATLKAYYDTIVKDAESHGFVTTLAGRRRLLPELHSRNTQLVSQARRQAVNTVIQGSAADIIKMAMVAAHKDKDLAALGAHVILQVHDELIIEAPEASIRPAGERLKTIMQSVADLAVPLKVDLGLGRTWAEAH